MEKKLNVVGIAKRILLYRGQSIMPKQRFEFVMTEKDFDLYKEYMEVLKVEEQCEKIIVSDTKTTLVSEPEIKQEIKPKGDEKDVNKRVSGTSKKQHTKQI